MAEFSQKVVNQYLLKSDIFKNGPKVAKYLVYFYKKKVIKTFQKWPNLATLIWTSEDVSI